MRADEIKKALKGLPHIKTVWVDAKGEYYTVAIRGTQPLHLDDVDEINESVAEVKENVNELPPKTATNKRKPK
jgi:hypothetical protein